MKNKRRKFTKSFKLKVILEALKERLTVKEICQKFTLPPNQLSKWKQDFLDKAEAVMDEPLTKKSSEKDDEKEKEKLYSKIGQLQIEVDYLKKKLS